MTTQAVGTPVPAQRQLLAAFLTYDNAKTVLFWYTLLRGVRKFYYVLRTVGLSDLVHHVFMLSVHKVMRTVCRVPYFQRKLTQELDKVTVDIAKEFSSESKRFLELPDHGLTMEQVESRLQEKALIKGSDWKSGRVSGAVYHGGEDIDRVWTQAFAKFSVSNPLHPDVFPGVREMEAEIISMCLRLYNAPVSKGLLDPCGGAGSVTSGGTESIFMACKAHRDRGYAEKGIAEPEMVIPVSAHAAFLKSCDLLKITPRIIDVDPNSFKVRTRHIAQAINPNTIMIVGSAPNYGDGNIDDIASLSDIAVKANVPLHVDCCLGSFLVPYMHKVHADAPIVDFRLPGVISISCDTHKYGFGPKGASVVMYRSKDIRRYQYSITTQWPGGLYGSPTLAGSRPGAVIAGTWASMLYMGDLGYEESAKDILTGAMNIRDAIAKSFPELSLMGSPIVSVVAFTSDVISIYEVSDVMSSYGWHLASLQHPAGCHVAVTRPIVPAIPALLQDLRTAVDVVAERATPANSQLAQIYGLGKSTTVGPQLLSQVVQRYLDVTLSN